MAGSYEHIRGGGWLHIENMGDAYEAVEELLWLVEAKIGSAEAMAALEAEFYPMRRGELPKTQALLDVEAKMEQ